MSEIGKDSGPGIEDACEPADISDTDFGEDPELIADAPDENVKSSREGFAVYDPTDVVVEKNDTAEEWHQLGADVFRTYGDSLTGLAGYMGPTGGLLATLGLAVIIIRLAIPSASKVISIPILMTAVVAFIIGVFLLVFHLFHWLSNRAKGVELSMLSKQKMLNAPCGFLSITTEHLGLNLRCGYFHTIISKSPECVVCPHYSPDAQPAGDGVQNTETESASE